MKVYLARYIIEPGEERIQAQDEIDMCIGSSYPIFDSLEKAKNYLEDQAREYVTDYADSGDTAEIENIESVKFDWRQSEHGPFTYYNMDLSEQGWEFYSAVMEAEVG